MTTVGVIGAGLIGGSICKSLRRAGIDDIVVFSPSQSTQDEVRLDGFDVVDNISELVANVEYLFVCVPLDKQLSVFNEIVAAIEALPHSGVVVTDVSSVKGEDAREILAMFKNVGVSFVPGHPMAGTESSGYSAATAEMFDGATWVLCPDEASGNSLLGLMKLVLRMGARISLLDTETHDATVAVISHMPYVAAAAVANLLSTQGGQELALQLAAGSFRDGTRVAGSEPWLSASMVTFNRTEVLRLLNLFQDEIAKMKIAIEGSNNDEVLALFASAQNVRRAYEKAKENATQQNVVWSAAEAIAQLLNACKNGALISGLAVTENSWSVRLEGTGSPQE